MRETQMTTDRTVLQSVSCISGCFREFAPTRRLSVVLLRSFSCRSVGKLVQMMKGVS